MTDEFVGVCSGIEKKLVKKIDSLTGRTYYAEEVYTGVATEFAAKIPFGGCNAGNIQNFGVIDGGNASSISTRSILDGAY